MTIKVKKEDLSNEETRIQLFVNQMLASRIFTAVFVGRFYVEHLNKYRDVLRIQIEEKDIIKDLLEVKKRIFSFYKGAVWPAITGPNLNKTPTGHCIWVKLNKNLPLGEARWFLIEKAAIGEEGELVIKIKNLRNVSTDVKHSMAQGECNSVASLNLDKVKHSAVNFLKGITSLWCWDNTKESMRFLFILLMAIVTVILNVLEYLGEFTLKFFREFNNFIRVSTPIFLAIIDLIKKSIGGFFILIAMMWRGGSRGPPPEHLMRIQGPYQNQRKPRYLN